MINQNRDKDKVTKFIKFKEKNPLTYSTLRVFYFGAQIYLSIKTILIFVVVESYHVNE